MANNPSLVAVTEALTRLGAERSAIRLLSVGTGVGKNYYPLSNADKKWGFLNGWGISKFISMLFLEPPSGNGQQCHTTHFGQASVREGEFRVRSAIVT